MKSSDYLRIFEGVRQGIDSIVNALTTPEGDFDKQISALLELESSIGEELGRCLLMDMKAGDFKEVTDEV